MPEQQDSLSDQIKAMQQRLDLLERDNERLRAKLEPAGIKIRTVRGFGYMLEDYK